MLIAPYIAINSTFSRRSNCCLSIHNSPPNLIYFYLCPRRRSRGNLLLHNDCPHLSKDTKYAKYTVCKNLLTYIHPKTPKLFRGIKAPLYTQGHEICKVDGLQGIFHLNPIPIDQEQHLSLIRENLLILHPPVKKNYIDCTMHPFTY